ncbi:MAG: hypothetical protein ABIP89_12255, partial [Polyangiaceae bacterium]
ARELGTADGPKHARRSVTAGATETAEATFTSARDDDARDKTYGKKPLSQTIRHLLTLPVNP